MNEHWVCCVCRILRPSDRDGQGTHSEPRGRVLGSLVHTLSPPHLWHLRMPSLCWWSILAWSLLVDDSGRSGCILGCRDLRDHFVYIFITLICRTTLPTPPLIMDSQWPPSLRHLNVLRAYWIVRECVYCEAEGSVEKRLRRFGRGLIVYWYTV
jgi:hypothetical protein